MSAGAGCAPAHDRGPISILRWGSEIDAASLPQSVEGFLARLAGPSLLWIRGRDSSRTRIVSTLLHGNEPSGVRAVHAWLRAGAAPAVDALIFVAAVRTALAQPVFAHRFLPGRIDMNRCWLPPFESEEGELAHQVLRLLRESRAETLIDLHNNTGHNPPYGVGPVRGAAELNLVSLFGERFVHSPLRLGTLVEATRDDFPSVTIECGRSGDPLADATALRGLRAYLELPDLELRQLRARRVSLLINPLRVCVRAGVELAFGDAPVAGADVTIALDVDRHNFDTLGPGTPIGWIGARSVWPLEAIDEALRDRSGQLFEIHAGRLLTRRSLIPIMMTTNRTNALEDCLFYVVERGETLEAEPAGAD